MNKNMLIIGNGPSSKELEKIGFNNIPEDFDTFGMNSFYRYGEKINWWPTYYAAYDSKVTPYHKKHLKKMMEEHNEIKKIFSYPGALGGVPRYESKMPNLKHLTTGGGAAWLAIQMGYEKIVMIGIDCNYIDFIDECEKYQDALRIKDNPKDNPNYFFNEYQLKGDQYRRPNKSWHHDSWKDVKDLANRKKIKIVNCSDISEITWFDKSTLQEEFKN